MKKRMTGCCVLALGIGCGGLRAMGDTIEEITKKITEASKKVNSFSAKSKTVTQTSQEGFSMVATMTGMTEMLRDGDEFLMRSESDSVTEMNMGGQVTKQESSTLMINDGTYAYTVSDMGGMKTAYKSKIEKSDIDPLETWKDSADLKVLPDASVDGFAVWVIEATPKVGNTGRTVIYYHKDSGQMIKMEVFGENGKPMTTTTCSDIKVNGRISKDRFVFKAPPGVTVQEMPN